MKFKAWSIVNERRHTMVELTSLIYASRVTPGFQDSVEIDRILKTSRINNKGNQLTGLLLCNLSYFLQVLEGSESVLNEVYRKIEADPRHCSVTKIAETPVAERQFSRWTMGFYLFQSSEASALPTDWTRLNAEQARMIFHKAIHSSSDSATRTLYNL